MGNLTTRQKEISSKLFIAESTVDMHAKNIRKKRHEDMKLLKPLLEKRCTVIGGFLQLGFDGIQSFYNVCKSIDATLNGFGLIQFYKGYKVTNEMVADVENILNVLKNE